MSKYYIIDSSGNKIPVESEGLRKETVLITADKTITAIESGTTFLLDAIGEDITLPAVSDGLNYKFIITATTATTDWTITAATAVIQGSAEVAGAVLAAEDESLITLVIAKALPGDHIELESDGTNWYVSGSVVTALGVTFTAP